MSVVASVLLVAATASPYPATLTLSTLTASTFTASTLNPSTLTASTLTASTLSPSTLSPSTLTVPLAPLAPWPLGTVPGPLAPWPPGTLRQDPPPLTAPVNDFANVIDEASERELTRRIEALKNVSGDVVIVATVPTFQPFGDITEYKVKMFENHGKGIGDRAKDNGMLVVVAVEDRKVGIEVGYGLEPYVTDGFAGQTIRTDMLPEFRQGRYGPGLLSGVTRLANRIAEQRGLTLENVPRSAPAPEPATRTQPGRGQFPGTLVLVVILLIIMMSRRRRRRRHWGGGPWSGWSSGVGPFGTGLGGFGGGFGGFGGRGGGGGGFGGFGGGRSGGGGASGGW
jgi:uncharacterized protein